MRTKLLGLPLAGLLLVGGATAVLAQSGAAGAITGAATRATTLLGEVLDDLVGDGTIERSQADAILEAVDERRTELREQAEALREQMRTFLQDGTLSADELAQLPADHPLRNLDQFLEDGQLTRDELRQPLENQPPDLFAQSEFRSHAAAERFAQDDDVARFKASGANPFMRRLRVPISALLGRGPLASAKPTIIE
jgi:polyhydroxyalkanoate synthesis regulator phasin